MILEMNWRTCVCLILTVQTVSCAKRRPFGQLPTTLTPVHYRLTVQPFFPADGVTYDEKLNFTFNGNVSILIECLDETDNITMHMGRIKLKNDSVVLSDIDGVQKNSMPLLNYVYDEKAQQVAFMFSQSLKPGRKYELNISYTGLLAAEDLAGFYTSSYVENGKIKWLAVTQMEPTDARRVLPCFDEPFYKAVFLVTIIHPSSLKALSNGMEERMEDLGNGWNATTFRPTLKMSTYLLALVVCDFRSKSNYTKDGKVLFRVWARPSFIDKVSYAVAAGPKVLDYYTDYFKIPFPLSKQDMIAIPDFQAGAMENWGLVTYRENALLYDANISSALNRQRVAIVVAHELSHQWFGNLVTMEWWDDLWLNEGFATFIEFIGSDIISDGAFDMDSQIVPSALQYSFALDQLDTSHPIFVPVSTADEVFGIFDDISYDKSGSVLRMLNYTLSNEVFRKGLHDYLTKRSYANANHNHLWEALTRAATQTKVRDWNGDRLNVSEFMNPWVLQMGYPVLDVKRIYGDKKKVATVSQRRFVLEKSDNKSHSNSSFLSPLYNFTWYVPLWYQTEGNSDVMSTWLKPNETLTLFTTDDSKWVLLNYEAAAYCRVNYDEKNWRLLQRQLHNDFTKINAKSRSQLVDDAFELARAGDLPYDIALDTTTYLVNETSMLPWKSADSNVDYLNDMLANSPDYKYFKAYVLLLTKPIYERYGFNDSLDSLDDAKSHYLRQMAVTRQCQFESDDCLEKALSMFRAYFNACRHSGKNLSSCSNNIFPALRSSIYCTGTKEDNKNSNHWTFLWNLHAHEQLALEKERLLYGLCCTKNVTLITKLLNEAINPNSTYIRRQDAQFVFRNLAQNEDARSLLWPFLEKNWVSIKKTLAKVGLSRIIISSTNSFNTEKHMDKMETFYKSHSNDLGPAKRVYQQQLERARANKQWTDLYGEKIIRWIKNYLINLEK